MARVNLGHDSSGRPLVVDDTWLAKFKVAEARLGIDLTIVQGSWRGHSGAAASAGTHDMGGVADIRTWNIPARVGIDKTVRVLRECGLIAWHRTKAQGFDDHIHAIDYGNPSLSPSAARQVVAWERGRNGLANNGPDDGPRVNIPKKAPEDDMPLNDADKKWIADTVNGAVKGALADALGDPVDIPTDSEVKAFGGKKETTVSNALSRIWRLVAAGQGKA